MIHNALSKRNRRKPAAFADEPIDRRFACAGQRFWSHSVTERRQLLVRVAGEVCANLIIERFARAPNQLVVERREPSDQLTSCIAAKSTRLRPRGVEL